MFAGFYGCCYLEVNSNGYGGRDKQEDPTLHSLLVNGGYDVNFAGSQSHPETDDQVPPNERCLGLQVPVDFHRDHAGYYGGFTIQVKQKISTYQMHHPPDIIWLPIGTNDLRSATAATGPNIVPEVSGILNWIDTFESAHSREITVLLA